MKKFIVLLLLSCVSVANAASYSFSFGEREKAKIKATCSCPDGYPLMDVMGYCYTCDEAEVIKLTDEESCERICNGLNGTTKRIANFWGCKLEFCPQDKPLEDSFGNCKSCQYDGPITSDTENCSKCQNRTIKRGECVISDCSNRPLIGANGVCYSCNTELSVETLRGKCSSVCPNRKESGSWSSTTYGVTISGVSCILKNKVTE